MWVPKTNLLVATGCHDRRECHPDLQVRAIPDIDELQHAARLIQSPRPLRQMEISSQMPPRAGADKAQQAEDRYSGFCRIDVHCYRRTNDQGGGDHSQGHAAGRVVQPMADFLERV